MIATDGSECSESAIEEYGRLFPHLGDAEVKIVSVVEEPYVLMGETFGISSEAYQSLCDGLEKLAEKYVDAATEMIGDNKSDQSTVVTSEVLKGPPEKVIVDAASEWRPDVLVVGSHGRGFWGRMLGSVSDAVAHDAGCSVLIAKPAVATRIGDKVKMEPVKGLEPPT